MTADWSKFLSSDEDHARNLEVQGAERSIHSVSEVQAACSDYNRRKHAGKLIPDARIVHGMVSN
mgnify:CR=1 FL=1|jgi:hypothetical protein|tara:strand:+ start:2570 stop:2761 length:192 start_codon:yes stop_codon:yes gene_type:complete